MAKVLEFESITPTPTDEELNEERIAIIEQALAGRTINFCTNDRGHNFGDPEVALKRAGSPANID